MVWRNTFALSRPTSSAPATAVPTAGGEILRRAAQRADIARQLLRRRRDQHVEQQCHQRPLADAEHDQPEHAPGPSLQSLRHDKGEPQQRRPCSRMKPIAADLPRREPIDRSRTISIAVKNTVRLNGIIAIACRKRRAALHDLDVERHREIQRRLQRDDGKHRVDRGPLLRGVDHLERKQRRLSRRLPPVRPHEERLAEHDAEDDHDRRRRQAEEVERRVGRRQPQPPAVQVVEAEADAE